MMDYTKRLHQMSDAELAKEWSHTWYDYRKHGRTGTNITAYNQATEKLSVLRDVIVERFVQRAYAENRENES